MSKRNRKQKQEPEAEKKQIKKEKAGLEEVIDRELEDDISKEEASILLDALIEHFDGFARQQEMVIKHILRYLHLRAIPRTLSSYEARLESSFVPLTICRRSTIGAINAP